MSKNDHLFACSNDVIDFPQVFCLEATGSQKMIFHPNWARGWPQFSAYGSENRNIAI